jgi:hypothetical protein
MLPTDLLATERARVRVRLDDQTDVALSIFKKQETISALQLCKLGGTGLIKAGGHTESSLTLGAG